MSKTLVIQFAKYPQLGTVKTRLQPTLGAQGCLSLHEQLVAHTAAQILQTPYQSALFVSHSKDHVLIDRLTEKMQLKVQQGNDLGEKMFNAFDWGLSHYDHVILVGSDCPVITADHYHQVNRALEQNDFCFIPAEDGGYVLVAAKKRHAGMFQGIQWGTGSVWQQTQLALQGERVAVLDPLWDVDRAEDFNRLKQTIPSLCVL